MALCALKNFHLQFIALKCNIKSVVYIISLKYLLFKIMKFILAILYIVYFDHPYFLLSFFK